MGSSEEYDGKVERRQDNVSVRLALLESHYTDLKDSQISIHKRITDFKSEMKEDMRVGFRDLRDDIKGFVTKAEDDCIGCAVGFEKRLKVIEGWRAWITGAYIATATIVGGWIHFTKKGG
jgi:hypothetical protein